MLGYGLDHEIHAVQRRQTDRELDPADQRVAILLAELAPGHGPVGGADQVLATAFERGLGDLDRHDGDAIASEDFDDARAHRAESYDADAGELTRHRNLLRAGPRRPWFGPECPMRMPAPGQAREVRLRTFSRPPDVCPGPVANIAATRRFGRYQSLRGGRW